MKRILVCMKAIPEIPSPLSIDDRTPWVVENESGEYRMNRFDEFALEEAIRIRESLPEVIVDVLSVGTERIRPVLRRAMAVGAENGIHIHDDTKGFVDAKRIAALIAGYAATKRYDLILTGVMAEDDMQGLVGPFLAEMLGLPCATAVMRQELNPLEDSIQVTCEMEAGLSERAVLRLPAVLTIQSGINRPRYPSLSNMLRSRTKELMYINACQPEEAPRTLLTHSIQEPPDDSRCSFLSGSAEEKAEKLLRIFAEKALLRKRMGIP